MELPKTLPVNDSDVVENSGISLTIIPPSPTPSEKEVPTIIPPEGSTKQEVKEDVAEQKKDEIEQEKDLEDECSCYKCQTPENRHSYSNSSVEEEESALLLKSVKKDKEADFDATESDHQEVIKALVHHDSQGASKSGMGGSEGMGTNQDVSSAQQGKESDDELKTGVKLTAKNSVENKKVNFNEDISVQIEPSKSPVLTGPTKRHLWSFGGKRSSKSNRTSDPSGNFVDISADQQSQGKTVQLKSFKRMTSTGKYVVDENGDSRLVEDDDKVTLRPHNESQETTQESGSRESWAMRKIRRSIERHHEQNNNDGDNTDQGVDNDHLMRKWRLVLNIQKFESSVRRPQEKTPLPELDGEEKVPSPARLRDKIVS